MYPNRKKTFYIIEYNLAISLVLLMSAELQWFTSLNPEFWHYLPSWLLKPAWRSFFRGTQNLKDISSAVFNIIKVNRYCQSPKWQNSIKVVLPTCAYIPSFKQYTVEGHTLLKFFIH